jgi:hypothetical protein
MRHPVRKPLALQRYTRARSLAACSAYHPDSSLITGGRFFVSPGGRSRMSPKGQCTRRGGRGCPRGPFVQPASFNPTPALRRPAGLLRAGKGKADEPSAIRTDSPGGSLSAQFRLRLDTAAPRKRPDHRRSRPLRPDSHVREWCDRHTRIEPPAPKPRGADTWPVVRPRAVVSQGARGRMARPILTSQKWTLPELPRPDQSV